MSVPLIFSMNSGVEENFPDKEILPKSKNFCPECGVRIYGKPGYVEGLLSLKPGTLDNTSWLEPTAALWVKSSQKWIEIPKHMEQLEEQ